ncbi:cytochrome-c peroxidase [Photobacterium aphoticum]|nr:cytochrome c peroxidase [Photobacterium aphoticum]GHA45910.1 methylamine utilization protein [Photobacterium aphoticum]
MNHDHQPYITQAISPITDLRRRTLGYQIGMATLLALSTFGAQANEDEMTYIEEMGKRLFFEDISVNNNMSCSTCHTGSTGGTNNDSQTNLTDVAVTGSDGILVGTLKPPTNQYAQFHNDEGKIEGLSNFDPNCPAFGGPAPCGGAFWNGRAEGDMIEGYHKIEIFAQLRGKYDDMYRKYLGPLADQAHASPFTNPVEQAKPTKKSVCEQVSKTQWGPQLYNYAFGTALRCGDVHVDKVFARFALAIAAWQMSADNNRFDSKRDVALKNDADGLFPLDDFTAEENRGHDLFYGVFSATTRPPGARCFFCHQSGNDQGVGAFERYTNDRYFNIGVPRNFEIPNSPEADVGLFATTSQEAHRGEHKVPTLRNVDKRPHPSFVKAYTHNGWFKSLEELIHFYNSSTPMTPAQETACAAATSDEERMAVSTACFFGKTQCADETLTSSEAMAANCWPVPEVDQNVARFGVGDLRLTAQDEADVVAYLKTLSDESTVQAPQPYRLQPFKESRMQHGGEVKSEPIHFSSPERPTRPERPSRR